MDGVRRVGISFTIHYLYGEYTSFRYICVGHVNSREKQKQVVARLHEKIRNTRKDYQHKVTSRLVSENPGGEPQAIAVEKLVVSKLCSEAES